MNNSQQQHNNLIKKPPISVPLVNSSTVNEVFRPLVKGEPDLASLLELPNSLDSSTLEGLKNVDSVGPLPFVETPEGIPGNFELKTITEAQQLLKNNKPIGKSHQSSTFVQHNSISSKKSQSSSSSKVKIKIGLRAQSKPSKKPEVSVDSKFLSDKTNTTEISEIKERSSVAGSELRQNIHELQSSTKQPSSTVSTI